jgi:hypothetical protein
MQHVSRASVFDIGLILIDVNRKHDKIRIN